MGRDSATSVLDLYLKDELFPLIFQSMFNIVQVHVPLWRRSSTLKCLFQMTL